MLLWQLFIFYASEILAYTCSQKQALGNARRIIPSTSRDFQTKPEDLQFQAVFTRHVVYSYIFGEYYNAPFYILSFFWRYHLAGFVFEWIYKWGNCMSRLIYRYKCQRLIFPVLAANHTLGSASVRTAGYKTTAPVLQPLEMTIHALVKKKKILWFTGIQDF